MSVKVYVATTIGPLSRQLAHAIKTNDESIFQSTCIVSSDTEVIKWLKVTIAEENSIAANLVITSSRKILTMVYKILQGKNRNKTVINTLQKKWLLNQLLGDDSFTHKFPSVANYYYEKPAYRLALAEKLATLFDQYSLYMPDTLDSWNRDEVTDSSVNQEWQKQLWNSFQQKISGDFLDDYQLYKFIKQELRDVEKAKILKEKLPSVYIFNSADLNTSLLDVFSEIGQAIEVHIFHTSPVREIKESYQNDLVQNLKGNSTFILNFFKEKNIAISWLDEDEKMGHNSLLHNLQNAIIKDERTVIVDTIDSSLVINSCYSPMREVEVLYNYLVKTVNDTSNGIGARDVVVYCSDIGLYAPAISAVFENAPYHFPYYIAGQREQTVNSSLNAFEAILNINPRWLKPSAVMQFLEYPSIIQKYQIADVDLLRNLVSEANIRNGFSGNKDNETNLISWQHGLRRLCYGMLISGEDWFNDGIDEYLLIDRVEGSNADDLVRLNYLVNNLHTFLLELEKERTFVDWILILDEGCNLFFNTENDIQLAQLTKELSAIKLVAVTDEVVGFATFYPTLQKVMHDIDLGTREITNRGIRFCSISNGKPIPNAIVALLGLNATIFPRLQNRLSYDLIKSNQEAIMQDVREKDKSFFLEAILSAKQHLYISYIGKSSKDNSEFPPSSLVDALLDYLGIKNLVSHHPLHSFNSKYFEENPNFYSYLGKNTESDNTEIIFDESKIVEEDNRKIMDIPLYELINFFKDSFKYYYNKQLGIYYNEVGEGLQDAERFEIDTLQKWELKKMLTGNTTPTPIEIKALKVNGKIPLGAYGEILLGEIQDEVQPMSEKIQELRNGYKEEKRKVNYEIDISGVVYRIKGQIDAVFVNDTDTKYLYSNVSSSQYKYQLEAYLHFLFLNQNELVKLEFVTSKSGSLKIDAIEYVEAYKDSLPQLITIFVNSKTQLNPFYINENVVNDLVQIDSNDVNIEHINSAFEKDSYLSKYVCKEIESNYFGETSTRQMFTDNCKLLNDLIFKNFS